MSEAAIEHKVDRTGWPSGEWDSEPDKEQFVDEATGLDCLIVRNPRGALCGYVGVPEGHPWYGQGYDDCKAPADEYLDVHGGLTYADKCRGHICHVPEPGRPDNVWWLGFDCMHAGDLAPGYVGRYGSVFGDLAGGDTYRTIEYVRRECRSLARQAAEAAKS